MADVNDIIPGIQAVINTAPVYLKGRSDLTVRGKWFLSMIKMNKRLRLNDKSTHNRTWNAKVRQRELRPYDGSAQLEWPQFNNSEQLNIGIRGYEIPERLTLLDQIVNDSAAQIFDIFGSKMKDITDDFEAQVNGQLYIDGSDPINEKRWEGLQTFLKFEIPAVTDRVAIPSTTAMYAGKGIKLGTFGGAGGWSNLLGAGKRWNESLTNDWPDGQGPTEFDCTAPLGFNYNSTKWPSGAAGWDVNCLEILDRAKAFCAKNRGTETGTRANLMTSEMICQVKDRARAMQRIIEPHKESMDLGFDDALKYDGVVLKPDFDCPAGYGFYIDFVSLLLFTMHKNLYDSRGPEWELQQKGWLFWMFNLGNVRYNTRNFALYRGW